MHISQMPHTIIVYKQYSSYEIINLLTKLKELDGIIKLYINKYV